jgi:nucleotide-binding universal stress UspA family protein
LLRVVEPGEFQHFASIGNLMRDEARQDAEILLQRLATEVNDTSGELSVLYVREGVPREELLKLIDEEPAISILVLAAGTGPEGPGPLVSAVTGRYVNRLRIPVTIVPGSLTDQAIDELT